MKTSIFGTSDRREINPEWFTGEVWMKVLSEKIKSEEQDMYHVHFQRGARTKLHSHNGAQVLIVTGGSGSLETYRRYGTKKSEFAIKKTSTIGLKKGDVAYIRPKSLHSHGSASKSKEFSHIAINVLPSRNSQYKTEWYESDYKTRASKM